MSQFEDAILFKRIIDNQSLAKAAQQSGLNPSAVSKRLAKLEMSLGTQLINRTTRRLALTESGDYFYEKMTHLQHEWAAALDEAASLSQDVKGTLRIAAPQTLLSRFLIPLLASFRQQYPAITFELLHQEINQLPLIDADISISREITHYDSHTMRMVPFYQYRNSLFASPSYLENYSPIKELKHLQQHSCIVYQANKTPTEWEFTVEKITLENVMVMNSAELMISAAKSGLGIVYLPEVILQEELKQQQLLPVLHSAHSHTYKTCAYYLKADFVPLKVRVLIDFLKQQPL
ncbi:MAG: LysR family transcriptional regulator [Cellvibrionaceae bacterium]